MSSGQPPRRQPKRERKKMRAAERRLAMLQELQRRRQRRIWLISGITAALLAGGGLVAFIAGTGGDPEPTPAPAASPTPAPTPAPIACDAPLPDSAGGQKPQFGEAEDQGLDRKKTYIWRLETSCGRIDIELDVARAPKTTNSIAFLTRKGFYDGLTFHRIVPGFVIQGGDPQGTGSGGPGYSVVEAPPKRQKYTEGVVAMAKTGLEEDGTSGSQFFVVTGPNGASLQPQFALVGTVTEGLDIAKRIEAVPTSPDGDDPLEKVFIIKATIVER